MYPDSAYNPKTTKKMAESVSCNNNKEITRLKLTRNFYVQSNLIDRTTMAEMGEGGGDNELR